MDNLLCLKLCCDAGSLFLVGLPFFILYIFGDPYRRGFYCDDDSIRYPFKDSTVPSTALFIVCIGLSIILIIVFEYFRIRKSLPVRGWTAMDLYFWLIYHQIALFAFGALASQTLTDIAKYSIGRLRPHFLNVCSPDINLCEGKDVHQYIEDYNCSNSNERNLRDARLSFMSGHSSFAAYSAVYMALYLHHRIIRKDLILVRSFIQVAILYTAIWVGFTRISDYKHHWSDVLVGLLQGTIVAILNARYVGHMFEMRTWGRALETRHRDSSSTSIPTSPNEASPEGDLGQSQGSESVRVKSSKV
ncbi:phospholipid phosphatase 1-like isoform X2 [Brevipalpus obovatus]|uniref:phospholipid phosphatase 1-like isoform X2 n=1 Tax=Brevipalpus obovatus TaxID=246614 RepID=UPI003D9DBB9A